MTGEGAGDLQAGLSAVEARTRLATEGFNELPAERRPSVLSIAASVMREPMFALLIAAAVVYAFIGDRAEAALLLVFATFSVTIAVVQRGRSERALDALRELTSPRALVIRDAQRVRIPGRDVVRGDLLVLAEGDRIPADAVIVAGNHLEIDESLLTGESVAVRKRATAQLPEHLSAPGAGEEAQVFGGTLVIRGSGLARVMATGRLSAMGLIGQSLAALSREQPRLERETRRLVLVFGSVALVLCGLAVLLYGLLRDSWLDALLGGIALGMALLPEEFPLVLTVFMVMGAWRLSRSRVLTRRASAIEALGSATVLCTDKTGTLTRNVMSIAQLAAADESWNPALPSVRIAESSGLSRLLATADLASDDHRIDPMERSLGDLQARVAPRPAATMLREYPLRPELLAVTRVWSFRAGEDLEVAAKGAPEAIAALCKLPEGSRLALQARVDELGRAGVRVLGVARARCAPESLPDSVAAFSFEFLGLVGFADPLRESVPEAVRECRTAGIRVVMITGDYPATAAAIAREAGIDASDVASGADLEALDDAALAQRVRHVCVFARVSPLQKLRIVVALKANGEIVAMTGDGINDAPALKAADIGIAMGGRGTDVAREASSIVLLDDDFGSIVRAVRLGRRIYDNLRKAMTYILAIHVPIAGLALLPIALGAPLLLTPLLIALLELIIDPACSVVLEAELEENDVMRRAPRSAASRLLSGPLIGWSLLQGALALAVVAAVFVGASRADMPADSVRTLAFVTLVGVNVALIFVNRTFTSSLRAAFARPNPVLWWGLGLAVAVLTAILGWPAASGFFRLGAVRAEFFAIWVGAALALLLVLEFAKRQWHGRLVS
ncbi:MAG: cation-translocating P-type ATPase [Pseudomonadota bacterium]